MRSDQNSNDEDEGLSAFDNLDPVSTLSEVNLVPEERPSLRSPSMPPGTQSLAGSRPSMPPASPFSSSPSLPPPVPAATLPSMPPPPPSLPPVAAQEAYGFDDEDESTQFYERGDSQAPAGAELSMDWTDDEPETHLRDEPRGLSSGAPSPFDDLAGVEGGYPSPFPAAPFSAPSSMAMQTSTEEWPHEERVGQRRIAIAIGLVAVAAVALAVVWKFGATKPAVAMLSTEPPDAEIVVDGMKLASSHSPFILELTPEERHEVVVSKEGFESQTLPISLESGERLNLPAVNLVSLRTEAGFALDSEPSGARVLIDGADSGKTTPVRMTEVPEGMHTIRLEADGGKSSMELQVFIVAGKVLELPKASLAPTVAGRKASNKDESSKVASSSPSTDHSAKRASRRTASKRRSLASASRPSAPKASTGNGVLRLNSLPWSQVTVDGKSVGNTPLMNLPLPAGKHTVRMVNPDMGLTKTIKVTVKAGDTVTKIVNMAQ